MQNAAYCGRTAYWGHPSIAKTAECGKSDTVKKYGIITKTLLVMKLTIILLIAGFLNVAAKGISQTVTFSGENVPVKSVFAVVEKQTGYVFFFKQGLLENTKPVTIHASGLPLEKFLNEMLKDQQLEYSIKNKNIIVRSLSKLEHLSSVPPSILSSPPITVRGRIVNENGEPVVASVMVKGTTKGVTSNNQGIFEMYDVDDEAVLVFSAANIETREIRLADNPAISSGALASISVVTRVETMNDVVINKGYYSEKKKMSTGNVSKVSSGVISSQPVSNPLTALSGRVPGLYITQSSGTPGSEIILQIRGMNSLRSNGNQPLFIIDGIPYPVSPVNRTAGVFLTPFQNLNPADIESIEVLKDADATAIYGSRGSNGVILVTTKKGSIGKARMDINAYTGFGKVTSMPKLLNTHQYLDMRHEAFRNDGVTPQFYDYDVSGAWDTTRYTNWPKLLIGNASSVTDAQLSLSGGENNTKFLLGGGYHKETSVMPGDFSDSKLSMRFSLTNTSANKKLVTQFSGSYLYEKNTLPIRSPAFYFSTPPDSPPLYDSTGGLNWENNTFDNPLGVLRQRAVAKTNNLIANLEVSYQIVRGLQFKNAVGINLITINQILLAPASSVFPLYRPYTPSSTTFVSADNRTWIDEPQLSYTSALGQGKLDAVVGLTFQDSRQNNTSLKATGFSSENVMENISAASVIEQTLTNFTDYRYSALFGRVGYRLKERYILNLTGRRDGSSRFGPGKRTAQFGAVGAAWIFSSEPFMQNGPLSFGKLRVSYGTSGNDQIKDYGYLNLFASDYRLYLGGRTIAPSQLFDANYSWETNRKFEGGLDIGFLHDRIIIAASYYRNRSSNQLVGLSLPGITGFSSVSYNLPATVQNSGVEIEVNLVPVKRQKFSWESNFNLSFPRNKLLSYPNIAASDYAYKFEVGKSLFLQKLYHYTGIDPQTGVYTYQDVNKDGSLSYPGDILGLADWTQRYSGGWQNTIRIGHVDVAVFFQYVKQTNYNYLNTSFGAPGMVGNQPVEVLDRWQKPGDLAPVQRFSQDYGSSYSAYNNAGSSNLASGDASYIRLKNVSVSYHFSNNWVRKAGLNNAKVYVQGQNLATITRYKVFDPETRGGLAPLRILTGGFQLNF